MNEFSPLRFKTIRINSYGDRCYSELELSGGDPPPSSQDGVWAIENPSRDCLQYYAKHDPKCRVRYYGDVPYLLSPDALEKVPLHNRTARTGACVVRFEKYGRRYYVLLIDDKRYVQSAQGGANARESGAETAAREVGEELGIKVLPSELEPIGEWSVKKLSQLVNCKTEVRAELFLLEADYARVAHLVPLSEESKLRTLKDIMIVPSDAYPFALDETQYVLIVPEDCLDDIGEFITLQNSHGEVVQYTFRGHHREILHRLSGSKRHFFTKYLSTFRVYV